MLLYLLWSFLQTQLPLIFKGDLPIKRMVSANKLFRVTLYSLNTTLSTAEYANEIVHLSLQKAHCLPILLYGVSAMSLGTNYAF
jgi:hypothetical protein